MRLPGFVLLASAFIASNALAQTAVQGTQGFPIGEKSRVHTGVDMGVGYDTNPQRLDTSGNQVGGSDTRLAIHPNLTVDVPGQSAYFGLGAKFSLERYLGTGSGAGAVGQTFSGGSIGVDLGLGANDSPVAFELKDTVARTPTLFSEIGTAGADELRFRQWTNRGQANPIFRPGGGALEVRTGYGNSMSFYDTLPDSQTHGILFETKLKFLPKTAAILAADLSFFSADDNITKKSAPYDVSIGVQGQITPRLSALARVGFGDALTFTSGFFSGVETSDLRTVVAQLNLIYAVFDRGTLSIGYNRHISSVILLNAYVGDSLQGRASIGIGPRMNLAAFFNYEVRNFESQTAAMHKAQVFTVDARAEYYFFDFLSAMLGYELLQQSSDEAGAASRADIYLEKYTRHVIFLNADLRY